ncbi:MAG: exodeoxyribonuclease VII small subunit [Peptococcaceae bacterium]|nr:exodeoxyribonuclease VII small subunit [Peptococcaceae bacterium]
MSDQNKNNMSFEEAMAQLETALQALSKGDISLDEAVHQYKLGLDMATFCQNKLDAAEGEIKILQENLEKDFQIEEL